MSPLAYAEMYLLLFIFGILISSFATTISLYLPAAEPNDCPQFSETPMPPTVEAPKGNFTVLAVDDDEHTVGIDRLLVVDNEGVGFSIERYDLGGLLFRRVGGRLGGEDEGLRRLVVVGRSDGDVERELARGLCGGHLLKHGRLSVAQEGDSGEGEEVERFGSRPFLRLLLVHHNQSLLK